MTFEVYEFGTEIRLGIFLNVGFNPRQEVVVWYLPDDGIIRSVYREDVELKKMEEFDEC